MLPVSKTQRGFSIIEVIIVLGVLAMIAAVAMPVMYRLLNAYKSRSAATTFATQLRYFRSAAVNQKRSYQIVVRDNAQTPPNTYSVLYDAEQDGSVTTPFEHVDTKLPDGLTILNPSVDTITFNMQGRATLSPDGESITLRSVDGTQYRLAISVIGAVTVTQL